MEEKINLLKGEKNENEDEDEWLPISDLMSGLMTIFILITISYIYVLIEERIKLEEMPKYIIENTEKYRPWLDY